MLSWVGGGVACIVVIVAALGVRTFGHYAAAAATPAESMSVA